MTSKNGNYMAQFLVWALENKVSVIFEPIVGYSIDVSTVTVTVGNRSQKLVLHNETDWKRLLESFSYSVTVNLVTLPVVIND